MTATEIKSGKFITSTTTEQSFFPDRGGPTMMLLVLVSGSVQVASAAVSGNDSPVIDNTYATWSTAGDKIIIEVDAGDRHLRIVGTGVVNVTY
jgi:hypothetical protein